MNQLHLIGVKPAPAATPTKRKTYVGAPATCQICNGSFDAVMYDARTQFGRWANLCTGCYKRFGCGLGTGLGQRYVLEADGWIKVAG